MLLAALAVLGMANPYLERVRELPAYYFDRGCTPGVEMPPEVENAWADHAIRYSAAIATPEALEAVAAWSPLVDFGAGSGYWSHLLDQAGADVVAIDNWSWGRPRVWRPVATGDQRLLPSLPQFTLLLVWPPRGSMAIEALRAWGGNRLIYIGEMWRGSGDAEFFHELDAHWRIVKRLELPGWWTNSDAVYLLERERTVSVTPITSWTEAEAHRPCVR